jgi:alcohol dehydrogenase class IV
MGMVNTTFVAPRQMLIGGGAVARIAEVLGTFDLARPLVVSDPVMVATGLIARALDPLTRSGIQPVVFSDTVSDPTDTVIEAGVAEFARGDFDCLIGFGGGSSLDTAKAIAILAGGGGKMRDYKVPVQADRGAVPVIAIPTTAGTGSECTRFTVITDTERGEKMLIAGLGALPLAAIVDYELTFTVPPRTTADTGIDSLTHALEAYVSKRANPFSDALALSAMSLIGQNIRAAYHDPRNAPAREAMMLGATQAGLAFSNASVALVHGMSRPIGAHFHVPHGLSNAMLLPAVTRFSVGAALSRYADAARRIGCAETADSDAAAAAKLVTGLEGLNRELAVPSPADYGIDDAAWHAKLELMSEQALASGSPANNPRVPVKEEIVALYREAWTGVPPNAPRGLD